MRARVLGPVAVDGVDGPLGGRRERTVLAVLALHGGRQVTEDVLAFALWQDDPPRTATRTVQSSVARLRRAVGDAIESVPGGGYRWAGEVDLEESDRLVVEARAALERGEPRPAAEQYDRALSLWHDRPLADLSPSSWIDGQVRRLEELRHTVADERTDAWLACGSAGELVPDLEAALVETPLRERRWAQLITALYRSGRQADGLRAYQRLREILAQELGIEPSPALRELESQVLSQSVPSADAAPEGSANVVPAEAAPTPTGAATDAAVDTAVDGLEVRDGGGLRLVTIQPPLVALGRAEDNDIVLADDEVSRRHAVLEHIAGGWVLNDLGSRNGSLVNGTQVSGRRSLVTGDEIRIGRARLVLRAGEPAAPGDETVAAEDAPDLTEKEHDVLVALVGSSPDAGGSPAAFSAAATNREIAERLGMSEAAVSQTLVRLYAKFGLSGSGDRRARLANEALQRGAVRS